MKNILSWFIIIFLASSLLIKANEAFADQSQEIPVNEFFYHKVKKGDTLWGISEFFYGTGVRWRNIVYSSNSGDQKIQDQYKLEVDRRVKIPKRNAVIKSFLGGEELTDEEIAKNKNSIKKVDYYAYDDKNIYLTCNGEWRVIEGADVESFQILGGYAKDKNHVYKGMEVVSNRDPETFAVVSRDVTKDKNGVYYDYHGTLKGADPETFTHLITQIQPSIYDWYKDKNNVYYKWKKVEGADPDTFQVLYNEYAKDKNNVYKYEWRIEGADAATYEILDRHMWQKDKNHVYRIGEIVEGADPETFELINHSYQKDKNHVYHDGKILEGRDPETFIP